MIRLAVSLAAALVLSLLALGTVWLRQAYTTLSEKHALAEAALRRRDRLSAMGELASTVAHEVRNPLNAIAMSAQRLRREFLASVSTASDEDRVELAQLLAVVEGETRRINDCRPTVPRVRPAAEAGAAGNGPGGRRARCGDCRTRDGGGRGVSLTFEFSGAGWPSSTPSSCARRSTTSCATPSRRRRPAAR